MFQKREVPSPSEASRGVSEPAHGNDTIIAAGVEIQGELKARFNVEIRGAVEGSVEIAGALAIRGSGRLVGSVTATEVVVEGEIEGDIAATEKVKICSTGRVRGDVRARAVSISDGAFFQGNVHMANEESAADKNKKEAAYATANAKLA